MLYLAGYLTTDDTALPGDVDRLRPLRIPNREVAKLYASEITGRFAQVAGGRDALDDLHRALVSGDVVCFAEELESVAFELRELPRPCFREQLPHAHDGPSVQRARL